MSLYVKAALLGLAGILGWRLMEVGWSVYEPREWSNFSRHIIWSISLSLPGLLLGVVESATLDGTRRRWATVLLGAFGSIIGLLVSEPLSRWIVPQTYWSDPRRLSLQRLEDCVFFALLGLIMGTFLSLPRRSLSLTTQYALGGLTGGGFGLMLLVVLVSHFHSVPYTVMMVVPFGVTASGIGLVPALFRRTWLTVASPLRREYLVVRKTMTIGSGQNADVHVPTSPAVAPIHALIEQMPGMGRRRLRHAAGGHGTHAFPPTRVNGRPLTGEQWLSDGDVLQIGSCAWTFHDRATHGLLRLGPPVPEAWTKAGNQQAAPASESQEKKTPFPLQQSRVSQTLRGPNSVPIGQMARDIGRVGTRLVCIEGPYAGRIYRLGLDETLLGSALSCAVSLPSDAGITPVQARLISQDKGGHTLSAIGSEGSIRVNGQYVTSPVALMPGDRIQVGVTVLRYQ